MSDTYHASRPFFSCWQISDNRGANAHIRFRNSGNDACHKKQSEIIGRNPKQVGNGWTGKWRDDHGPSPVLVRRGTKKGRVDKLKQGEEGANHACIKTRVSQILSN